MIKLCAFADEAASSLKGQIEALKRNNIGLVELRSVDGVNVSKISVRKAKKYRAMLDEAGIKVWSIGSPLGKVDVNGRIKKHFKVARHLFELANVFGTERVRCFSFFKAYDSRDKVIAYLTELQKIAEGYGVILCHENEKAIYGDTLARVQDLMQNVKGYRYVYDPANFLQVGESADATIDALVDKTDYFHIKDVIVQTGEIVPAGYGDGKIEEIVSRIEGDKVLSVEPHLKLFGAYAKIDKEELKTKFRFETNAQSFDAACNAIKDVLAKSGYRESGSEFIK